MAGGQGGAGGAGGQGGAGGTGYGGKGGEGGDAKAYGGDAKAYGGTAYGGKVEDSGNSYNRINNTDHNKNEQDQKQKQQQQQQQRQSIKDSGNSEIKNSGNSEIRNSGNSEIKNSGNSYNKNQNDNSNSNNAEQEVNVNTYNERAPVNTAYAAGLAAGEDTCMGSSSLGAQAVSFGVSIGTTWTDDNCRRLKNSRQMVALGYHRAATALMCVDKDVEEAMARAGTPCPGSSATVAAAPIVYQEAAAPVRQYASMTPIADQPAKKKRRARKPLAPK